MPTPREIKDAVTADGDVVVPLDASGFGFWLKAAPPAREVLTDSRTMKGGGAAVVAALGAAGGEVAQQVLAETQKRHPFAGPVSRHPALGVLRRGARQSSSIVARSGLGRPKN